MRRYAHEEQVVDGAFFVAEGGDGAGGFGADVVFVIAHVDQVVAYGCDLGSVQVSVEFVWRIGVYAQDQGVQAAGDGDFADEFRVGVCVARVNVLEIDVDAVDA